MLTCRPGKKSCMQHKSKAGHWLQEQDTTRGCITPCYPRPNLPQDPMLARSGLTMLLLTSGTLQGSFPVDTFCDACMPYMFLTCTHAAISFALPVLVLVPLSHPCSTPFAPLGPLAFDFLAIAAIVKVLVQLFLRALAQSVPIDFALQAG